VLSITSDAIRSSGLVAPRPSDFQSVNLHVRHARFTARVVQVRGAETTLAVSRGLPGAARPLPAEAEMSFEHDSQIVMLSGTLLGADDVSARFRIDDGIAPRELRRFARLAVSLPVAVTPLSDDGREAGPTEELRTVDISAGGVLLDRQGMAGAVRVEIDLPGGYGAMTAIGRVVRNVADGSGVSFEGLDAETLDLVDRFVLAVRHQLAHRFAQAGG
jgi:PilZ domain